MGKETPLSEVKILKLNFNPDTLDCQALVQGSQIYTVSYDGEWRCSCPGFLYNKHCKHIKRVKAELFIETGVEI